MSYLDDAVHAIRETPAATFYVVEETDVVGLSGAWDAHKYAERRYRRDNGYDGDVHTVAEERDDGYAVVVMEENT